MPRTFFHLHDGIDRRDREGVELPGRDAARVEALLLMGTTITDVGIRREAAENWRLAVVDEAGRQMFRLDVLMAE